MAQTVEFLPHRPVLHPYLAQAVVADREDQFRVFQGADELLQLLEDLRGNGEFAVVGALKALNKHCLVVVIDVVFAQIQKFLCPRAGF